MSSTKFLWNLYKGNETNIKITDVLENITEMQRVSKNDKLKMDERISGEMCKTLKQMRNDVVPGLEGFGGGFHEVLWNFFKIQ